MNSMAKWIPVVALMTLLFAASFLHAGNAYRDIVREFSAHDNRLPGSPAYTACIARLETTLRSAGLKPHRQTFDTLVPETRQCSLVVDGRAVSPVYALSPNGAANNTTDGKEICGPLVWLGNGTIEEMKGTPVEGSIAVLNFNSPNMQNVFSQGALAIVFVGNGRETQWDVRQQFREVDTSLPRLFVHERVARWHGLMSGKPGRTARLTLTTVWKDVEGVNLWVEIPGEKGATFGFDQEEAVVLSATMDTFGTVPTRCPGVREAANCALLAEVAIELAKRPLKRSVFVVFFGSHYAMQDGARMFYHTVRRSAPGELESRAGQFNKIISNLSTRIEVLNRKDFFAGSHPDLFMVANSLDKRLAAKASGMNYTLSGIRRTLAALNRVTTPGPAETKTRTALEAEKEFLSGERTQFNDLRRQLNRAAITNHAAFAAIAAEESAWVSREIMDYQRLFTHNQTYIELFNRLGDKRIIGHYGFDFANAQDDWTLSVDGIGAQMFYHSVNRKWSQTKAGDFIKNLRDITAMDTAMGGSNGPPCPALFTAPVLSMLQPDRLCVPSVRSVPSRVAHAVQVFGYQMMTVADPLDGDELPYVRKVDLEPLTPRLAAFCRSLATAPELSQSCPLEKPYGNPDTVLHFRGEGGMRYLNYVRGSTDIEGVPMNAVVFCGPRGYLDMPCIAGNSYFSASRIIASGHIIMPIMYDNVHLRPLGFTPGGAIELVPIGSGGWKPSRLFYGYGGSFFLPLVPGTYGAGVCTRVEGESDSMFRESYGQPFGGGQQFYANKPVSFKAFANGGVLLLGSTAAKPQGSGISLQQPPLYSLNALRQSAHDYLVLNESRLKILRDKAIVNDSIESLHADAAEHWAAAVEARTSNDIPAAVAHEAFAAAMGARVSVPLREVTNDMIRAVVLLLLLTIPFAFVMERLILNAVSIYRQVGGFAAIFVATFFLLYMAHPAFALASSPIIIFLAFVIILLSVVVMAIVMSKFKRELREIQGLSTSAHGVSSDSSTALAAVLIGISGMRNRPLKTFLTSLTIIMLTFTIVVFASFTPLIGVQETYLGKGSGPARIELRRFSGMPIPSMVLDVLKALYGTEWTICARESLSRGPDIEFDSPLVVFKKDTRVWEQLKAMVALDPVELSSHKALAGAIPGLASWAHNPPPSPHPPLFLHPRVAGTMALAAGETVTVDGKSFVFAGTFNPLALDQLTFMDRAKFSPPDFEISTREMKMDKTVKAANAAAQENFVDATRFSYYPSRSIGITIRGNLSTLVCNQLSAGINAIVMYAKADADVEGTAREVAKMFVGPVAAQGAKGANRFFFSKAMQASGFALLIVPLLLGGLIIFNSLLGSIVDRQKEIFTYSALGLAPPDVGALFFAESAAYAVLGGMGGYLLSQVVAKLVGICGELGWFVPPEMNFSSLASVLTILIVMAMVMISTIYPAIKAGRSANPGVARKWRMPKPDGDRIEFVFPFTVSAHDMGGILAFIAEHFENHGDSSLGSFAASGIELFSMDKAGACGLRAYVSLAPFDLGVMQNFTMHARPSEIEGIDEVVIDLKKVSGTHGSWLRGNRIFVDELRQQFLLWRSLPIATVEHYRSHGAASRAARKENPAND